MATIRNKKVFDATVHGVETKLAVLRPNNKATQEGQIAYSKAFRQAVEGGAILRAKLNQVMRDQNLWDDKKQAEYDQVTSDLLTGEKRLQRGGIKLAEARELALQMRRNRYRMRSLMSDRNELDAATAETMADNARFNFLVSACTVYAETGKPYFAGFDDLQSRDNDPVLGPAATALGQLLYGLDDDYEAKLPENKFLRTHKFCNDELALVDKQGRLVDAEGRLVDSEGRLIDAEGKWIDHEGNPLTEEGDYAFETQPFLDDETGEPVDENGVVLEAKTTIEADMNPAEVSEAAV